MSEIVLASTVISALMVLNRMSVYTTRIGIIAAFFMIGAGAFSRLVTWLMDGKLCETSTIVMTCGFLLLSLFDKRRRDRKRS